MKGHFRPYRSAAMPNKTEPTDRNMRTSVMPQVMEAVDFPNVSDRP